MDLVAEAWTGERLDDLKQEVEAQGRRMDEGFRDLRAEMRSLRGEMLGEMNGLRGEMNELRGELRGEMGQLRSELRGEIKELGEGITARFDAVGARLDGMYRVMILFGASMFAAMASLVAAVVVAQL